MSVDLSPDAGDGEIIRNTTMIDGRLSITVNGKTLSSGKMLSSDLNGTVYGQWAGRVREWLQKPPSKPEPVPEPEPTPENPLEYVQANLEKAAEAHEQATERRQAATDEVAKTSIELSQWKKLAEVLLEQQQL